MPGIGKPFKKGQTPWNKGLTKETDERVKNNAEKTHQTFREKGLYGGKKGRKDPKGALAKLGEKNPSWKGDSVKYRALHAWLQKHMPKKESCERCGSKKNISIACKGNYTRNFDDYEWLCRSCHSKEDRRNPKLKGEDLEEPP